MKLGAVIALAVTVAIVALNSVFVATEFALVSVDRAQLDVEAERGDRRARLLSSMVRRLSYHLSGVQLGITFFSVILGFLAEPSVATLLHSPISAVVGEDRVETVALIIALVLVTIVQMVVGELVPKAIAVGRPMAVARAVAPVVAVYSAVMGPFIRVFNGAANGLLGLIGIEPREELSLVRSRHELQRLVAASAVDGGLEPEEARLLSRTFRFREKTAGEILTPRTDLVALGVDATAADMATRSLETGYSRFPIYATDIDDIVGVCHVKSVLEVPPAERADVSVGRMAGPAVVVPESKPLTDLMVEMRSSGAYLVVVADEYGGTAGIVTLEDVLEEIVGEIDDEHDIGPSATVRIRRWGLTWVLDGRLHLDEVADACGLRLPEGDYETLAGFLLDAVARIPEAGDHVEVDGWRLQVVEMDRRRIATVRVSAPGRHVVEQSS